MKELEKLIRDVPDFPKKGIVFKDITPLLLNPKACRKVVSLVVSKFGKSRINKVVGVESRGFIFGGVVACRLNAGFIPVRKKGKLPYYTYGQTYSLEYGTDSLEVHTDAIEPGDRVLIIDDLLATGGTVGAVVKLIEKAGGKVAGLSFLIELGFLKGRKKLKGRRIQSLLKY